MILRVSLNGGRQSGAQSVPINVEDARGRFNTVVPVRPAFYTGLWPAHLEVKWTVGNAFYSAAFPGISRRNSDFNELLD